AEARAEVDEEDDADERGREDDEHTDDPARARFSSPGARDGRPRSPRSPRHDPPPRRARGQGRNAHHGDRGVGMSALKCYVAAPFEDGVIVRMVHERLVTLGITPTSSWAEQVYSAEDFSRYLPSNLREFALRNDEDLR